MIRDTVRPCEDAMMVEEYVVVFVVVRCMQSRYRQETGREGLHAM